MLFDAMDEGFYLAEALFDGEGRCVDVLYHDENPAAVRMVGQAARGRRLSELGPYEQHWRDVFGAVARTGEARRLQQYAEPNDTWYDFYVFRPPEAAENRFAVVFRDVTREKRTQEALRKNQERQAFLLTLADALRPLADPIEIQGAAAAALGEHLGVDRTYYCRIDNAQELCIVEREYVRGGASSVVGRYPFSAARPLLDAMSRGRPFVAADVETTPDLPDEDRPFFAGLAIGAFVCTPIRKSDELVAAMAVSHIGSRRGGGRPDRRGGRAHLGGGRAGAGGGGAACNRTGVPAPVRLDGPGLLHHREAPYAGGRAEQLPLCGRKSGR
jgi:hypothetical protein